MGLRLNRTERAQACPLPLVSEGGGPHLAMQQASWARVGRANALLSSPAPLVLEGPSHLPLLISPWPPSYAKGLHGLEGAFQGRGSAWELSLLPGTPVGRAIALCSSPAPAGGSLPPASPDLPGLSGTNPVWPPLLLPPSVPPRPTGSLGGSFRLLGHQGPPPVASRHPSCGEMLTQHLPPSSS